MKSRRLMAVAISLICTLVLSLVMVALPGAAFADEIAQVSSESVSLNSDTQTTQSQETSIDQSSQTDSSKKKTLLDQKLSLQTQTARSLGCNMPCPPVGRWGRMVDGLCQVCP